MALQDKKLLYCDNKIIVLDNKSNEKIYSSFKNIDSKDIPKNIKSYIDSDIFNLIPSALFDKTKIDSYLKLTSNNLSNRSFLSNKINKIDCNIIWAIDNKLKKNIFKTSSGTSLYSMLHLFIDNENLSNKNVISLNFTEDILYAICYSKDKLILANRFKLTGDADAIYYTLFCLEHSKLENSEVKIKVKGKYKESFIEQLSDYFPIENIRKSDTSSYYSLFY
mgnify:FL=1